MALLTKEQLHGLISAREGPCVSIYVPTEREGQETRENPLRFKNAVQQAKHELDDAGYHNAATDGILAPVAELLADRDYWRHQGGGLAVFAAPDFWAAHRLPLEFESLTVVAGRFHVKPLLPLFGAEGRCYVLAISQNEARFLECTRWSVRRLEVPNMPADLDEATRFDVHERHIQFRTGTGVAGQGRAHGAAFHGHGGGTDDAKDAVREYLRHVDGALHAFLRDEKAPLVLAGAESVLPVYREVSRYPHVTDDAVRGNPERVSDADLRDRAWPLVEPLLSTRQAEAADAVRQASGTERAVQKLGAALNAAHAGRVALLFVDRTAHRWGSFAPGSGNVAVHRERGRADEDLLDRAAVDVLRHGGTAYAVATGDMPIPGQVAGVLRY